MQQVGLCIKGASPQFVLHGRLEYCHARFRSIGQWRFFDLRCSKLALPSLLPRQVRNLSCCSARYFFKKKFVHSTYFFFAWTAWWRVNNFCTPWVDFNVSRRPGSFLDWASCRRLVPGNLALTDLQAGNKKRYRAKLIRFISPFLNDSIL